MNNKPQKKHQTTSVYDHQSCKNAAYFAVHTTLWLNVTSKEPSVLSTSLNRQRDQMLWIQSTDEAHTPESFEWQVGNWGTGGEVQVLQLWAELTEAITRAAAERRREKDTVKRF